MGRKNKTYHDAVNSLIFMCNNIDKIATDISSYICDDIEKDVKQIFKDAISNFYNDYTPYYYKRTYALRKVYKVYNDGKKILWNFDPSNMPNTHRINNSYIYHFAFEEGYHGGWYDKEHKGLSNHLFYRTPAPENSTETMSPYSIPRSKYPVVKSESPAEQINSMLDYYKRKQLPSRISKNIDLVFFKYDILL